jgi:signal transduction histidine kinase
VVKHAGQARAQVTIGYGDREVTVEITDNGRGMASPTDDGRTEVGQGLIGMRERVHMFDGELQAGPRPDGGFRVAARLPLAVDRR